MTLLLVYKKKSSNPKPLCLFTKGISVNAFGIHLGGEKMRRVKGKEKEGTPFSVDVETDLGQRFLVDDKKLSSRTR